MHHEAVMLSDRSFYKEVVEYFISSARVRSSKEAEVCSECDQQDDAQGVTFEACVNRASERVDDAAFAAAFPAEDSEDEESDDFWAWVRDEEREEQFFSGQKSEARAHDRLRKSLRHARTIPMFFIETGRTPRPRREVTGWCEARDGYMPETKGERAKRIEKKLRRREAASIEARRNALLSFEADPTVFGVTLSDDLEELLMPADLERLFEEDDFSLQERIEEQQQVDHLVWYLMGFVLDLSIYELRQLEDALPYSLASAIGKGGVLKLVADLRLDDAGVMDRVGKLLDDLLLGRVGTRRHDEALKAAIERAYDVSPEAMRGRLRAQCRRACLAHNA
jgi:hypothetical protein